MSHSQFHCTSRVYLDLHGLIFETSICYWQDQPGSPQSPAGAAVRRRPRAPGCVWGPAPPSSSPEGDPRRELSECGALGLVQCGRVRAMCFPGGPRRARARLTRCGVTAQVGGVGGGQLERRGVSVSLQWFTRGGTRGGEHTPR